MSQREDRGAKVLLKPHSYTGISSCFLFRWQQRTQRKALSDKKGNPIPSFYHHILFLICVLILPDEEEPSWTMVLSREMINIPFITRDAGRESLVGLVSPDLPARSVKHYTRSPHPIVSPFFPQSLISGCCQWLLNASTSSEENRHFSTCSSVQVLSLFWVPMGLRVRATWKPSVSSLRADRSSSEGVCRRCLVTPGDAWFYPGRSALCVFRLDLPFSGYKVVRREPARSGDKWPGCIM